jgi:hypothetical protein
MLLLLLAALAATDVSTIKVGPPTTVTELDLGKLKGELRQLAWSPDGTQFYVQTAEGTPPSEKLRHYLIPVGGGVPAGADQPPAWAQAYWAFKAGRSAPGLVSLTLDAQQTFEVVKSGTGPAGALDREASPIGGNTGNIESLAKGTDQHQKASVWRITLLGETVNEFVNEPPTPGLKFSWGPEASGAIAFVDPDGRLRLLDQKKHKYAVPGVKDALLPAWSMDGARLAWVQKSGRKKYTLFWSTVT